MKHAFVIPAYGQSPHLGDCLASLSAQTASTFVVIATSTPSPWLQAQADAAGLTLHVHGPPSGLAHDWNMALSAAPQDATWVTIAHQDDLYDPRFVERTLETVAAVGDALLAFTDYREVTAAGVRATTPLMAVKRVLLELGFLGRASVRSGARKRSLWFGTPIPCPSVTVRRDLGAIFDTSYGVSLDWAAWLDLCDRGGSFVWVREVLMTHRIHGDSETTQAIAAGKRMREDERLLRRLWPGWIARMIVRSYRFAYASNRT